MLIASLQKRSNASPGHQMSAKLADGIFKCFVQSRASKQIVLLLLTALLLFCASAMSNSRPAALAANPGAGNACSWYRVRWGDTLTGIARSYHFSARTLAKVNSIRNRNLIFVGQELCMPHRAGGTARNIIASSGASSNAMLPNGFVRWYDYSALQWSTRSQVAALLRQTAAQLGLPANLLLAIAWQESGWYQHVIARDGGIGVMQLMPYTTQAINAGTGIRRNPYVLTDNIYLGATYLSWLWHNFHGNLVKTISGYNEGGWSVIHRGISNWRYVNNVLALMRRF